MNSNQARLSFYFETAGIPPIQTAARAENLTNEVDAALRSCGFTSTDLDRLAEALTFAREAGQQPNGTATAAAIGVGAGAFCLSGSGAILDRAIEHGIEAVDFIWTHRDLFRLGWAAVAPEIESALLIRMIGVPGEVFTIAEKVLEFYSHFDIAAQLAALPADAVVEIGGMVGYAADVGWLAIVEAAGNITDIAEAAGTLGLSLAAGWVGKRLVDRFQQPTLNALSSRLERVRQQCEQLSAIRAVLRSGLPTAVVAAQLKTVPTRYMGF